VDAFGGVVLGGRHLFQRRGVDHHVDTAKGEGHPLAVAHVARKKAQGGELLRPKPLGQIHLHLGLLQLVAGID